MLRSATKSSVGPCSHSLSVLSVQAAQGRGGEGRGGERRGGERSEGKGSGEKGRGGEASYTYVYSKQIILHTRTLGIQTCSEQSSDYSTPLYIMWSK